VFEELGCEVVDAAPDLQDADEVFLTLRAFRSFTNFAPLLALKRAELKPEAVEEIEQGANFSAAQIAKAMVRHTQLVERMRAFQERYEFVVCAVNQVPPFDATLRFPTEIDGKPMRHYVEWMQSAYWISTTFHPAISVPAGFTPEGLPVGIQIVGRMRDDLGLFQFAQAFEQATRVGERRPALG
jgi:amidase